MTQTGKNICIPPAVMAWCAWRDRMSDKVRFAFDLAGLCFGIGGFIATFYVAHAYNLSGLP